MNGIQIVHRMIVVITILLTFFRYGASFALVTQQQRPTLYLRYPTVPQPTKQQFMRANKSRKLQAAPSSSNNGPISLKSAAIPLLDSGKALARTGELLIDMTTAMNIYGGALSSAGANIRNAGDNIAQAAASCRFKTANELVIDEIREAAAALLECSLKLQQAIDEANGAQNNVALARSIGR
jgi:hypothetical protein